MVLSELQTIAYNNIYYMLMFRYNFLWFFWTFSLWFSWISPFRLTRKWHTQYRAEMINVITKYMPFCGKICATRQYTYTYTWRWFHNSVRLLYSVSAHIFVYVSICVCIACLVADNLLLFIFLNTIYFLRKEKRVLNIQSCDQTVKYT